MNKEDRADLRIHLLDHDPRRRGWQTLPNARNWRGVIWASFAAYLAARWRGTALREDLDDATQEVFVECFRQGGVLDAAGSGRVPGFRAFLYGVIRNVARRFESRPVRAADPLPEFATDDASQSRLFDRTWAQAIMAEAGRLQRDRADERGAEAVQRVELLRLRFEENLPIRDNRPPLGDRSGDRPQRLCSCQKGVSVGTSGGRRVPSSGQRGRVGRGSGEPLEGAFLDFFCFPDFFCAKIGPALILG